MAEKKESEDGVVVKRQAPLGRSWHSMTKIDDQNIFLYGGLSQDDDALSKTRARLSFSFGISSWSEVWLFCAKKGDAWILNVPTLSWTKLGTRLEPRLWHTAPVASIHGQVYIYGGSSNDVYINQPKFPKHMLKISLSPESLQK